MQRVVSVVQVAACELLHSLVVYMVGKSAQMVEGKNTLPPMYKLHKRLFPVLLRLACDVDQVCDVMSEQVVTMDTAPKVSLTGFGGVAIMQML